MAGDAGVEHKAATGDRSKTGGTYTTDSWTSTTGTATSVANARAAGAARPRSAPPPPGPNQGTQKGAPNRSS